jgi:uncharacterized membrane protein YjjP (DUF1212 family)
MLRRLADDPVSPVSARSPALILSRVAGLLLANGQTTEQVVHATTRAAGRFGIGVAVFPAWGETVLRITEDGASRLEVVAVAPSAVDMRKVTGTMALVTAFSAGRGDCDSFEAGLDALAHLPPPSLLRFVVMAAAGAAALAMVFGAERLPELLLIALIAGVGGLARRGLARMSHNLFIQPPAAALLAGLAGGVALNQGFSSLVALCPCMILVPGPHLLNGALDLIRGRITLGAARIAYASMTIVTICVGLLLGLTAVGASLPGGASTAAVPLLADVIPAGVAVLAYGSYFAMPWRMLPIPVVIGMGAHALRWGLITLAHASPALGAFGACLLVGVLMTPISDRLHLPFAGCAFAAVVSLIPGVFLFRMAGSLVQIVALGRDAPLGLLAAAAGDGATAMMILIAMAAGLIIPLLLFTHPAAKA